MSEESALGKRARSASEDEVGPAVPVDDDSDDEIGPMPDAGGDEGENGGAAGGKRKKRRAVLPHERLYLEHLPQADWYYKSFMHRDNVNYVVVTRTNFIITTSVDGHLKLWKKQEQGIEFVKHYRTSLKAIVGVSASEDGALFASISANGEGRVFDVVNFDMINILKFGFTPKACCWVHAPGAGQPLLAVSDVSSPTIRIYDGRGDSTPLFTLDKVHRAPVHLMVYSPKFDVVISADEAGFVEYWQPSEPWGVPSLPGMWQFKSSTDLFHFKKTKTILSTLTFSPSNSHFAAIALPSRAVHIFNTLTGKLTRTYDESLTAISEMQQAGTAVFKLDDMDFGRRLATERELDRDESGPGGALRTQNAVWDESGNFVLYPTLLGIKVVNTVTNQVARVIGKDETLRFLNLSLFQGAPSKKGIQTVAMAASSNPLLQEQAVRDPTLFATAYKKPRFYMFGRDKGEDVKGGDRDVFNERPTHEERTVALSEAAPAKAALPTAATIHTSMGDIHLKLFPHIAPKTVENFATHARNGYYNNVIFHRIIKKFMLQGGDPTGTGSGGESIWGGEFEDEFSPLAKHDRPYTLSSANAGPNTNGSQFFITTVATPHLDNKHSVFGRAVGGLEVIHAIENVKTDKGDRPFDEVKMMSITLE
ncbi:Peptidyl-prolyl cis-trans isomerase cyp15 [Vanrija pseudolonga]|uniref:peptidylprolyl isomerase n=1 Tax=Vanrija pseudolonga TaxID=143232 RepID=A0AAF1BQF3_9TREE|nr:Peptidyl-prolyl cis-trans isomerase cyp15 [Vanrija pseudolonga]